jgi:hypothetical protein
MTFTDNRLTGYRVLEVPFYGEPVTTHCGSHAEAEAVFRDLATLAVKTASNRALFLYEHGTVVRRFFTGGW